MAARPYGKVDVNAVALAALSLLEERIQTKWIGVEQQLVIRGNLDVSVAHRLFDACTYVDEQLQTCVIDITRVSRVFDSGVALILVMLKRMQKFQVQLVIVGDIPAFYLSDSSIDNITRLGSGHLQGFEFAPARKFHGHTDAGKNCHCSGSVNCCSDNDHSCGCAHNSTISSELEAQWQASGQPCACQRTTAAVDMAG